VRAPALAGSLHHELHGHDDARARSTFLLLPRWAPRWAARLPAWEDKRGLYRPLALGLTLVLLLSIPWGFAVVRRLAGEANPD
jgi:hypothetical protein